MKKLLVLISTSLLLISCIGPTSTEEYSVDIINPDAEYLYFYGATCPHCQELNKMLEDGGYLSQISIEKREIYFNTVNQESFKAVGQKLGLSERETGVPFVLEKATGKYVTGVTDAFKMLTSNIENTTLSEENTQ